MPKKERTQIRLRPRLKREMKALAEEAGENLADFIRSACEREVERRRMDQNADTS